MNLSIQTGPFNATTESLSSYVCPEWFRDAKFGIWSHWGPQSVPMYGDWYARNMYKEDEAQYRHHWRVYGHPSKHGYHDVAALWRAENFDPDSLMSLYVDAGAKYFFGQAMHHDNFDNFDSQYQPFNSVNIGPKQDICKMWQEAAKAKGLPFGLSEHLAASYHWYQVAKRADKSGPYAGVPYVSASPEFESIYHANPDLDLQEDGIWDQDRWYTKHEWFHQMWFKRIKDVIDKFQPDILYSDGGVPFDDYGRSIIAHLYNTSIEKNGSNQAVYNQKDTSPEIACFGVLDIERGSLEDIYSNPWQTDTSVGDWYYNVRDVYKSPKEITETLVDTVSKNGNLMLNVPQKPDGTHDDECLYILKQLAIWTKENGRGIYGSRPWTISGEGPTKPEPGAFKEKAAPYTSEDFRFTASKSGDTVYAFQMLPGEPGSDVTILSLAENSARQIREVKYGDRHLDFKQTSKGLEFQVPVPETTIGPVVFTIDLN